MLTASTASYLPADVSDTVRETTVGAILRAAAEQAGSTMALVEGSPEPTARRRWSYAELLAEAEQTARALLARFEPGERVAVWANNIPEWALLEFGAAFAGSRSTRNRKSGETSMASSARSIPLSKLPPCLPVR